LKYDDTGLHSFTVQTKQVGMQFGLLNHRFGGCQFNINGAV